MSQFEELLGVLLVAVLLAAAARKIGTPYPAFLALVGAVLAFLPGDGHDGALAPAAVLPSRISTAR